MNTKELLLRQHSLYSGMEMEDVVKLLYQSEFGCGHYIESAASFCYALQEELASFEMRSTPAMPPEEIGGGYYRVHLSSLDGGPSAQTLTKLCVFSAEKNRGSQAGFVEKLKMVRDMIAEKRLPLSSEKWNDFLEDCTEHGCPPLRHSRRFRSLYHPHYRVIDGTAALFLPVFAAVDRALSQKSHLLVGVDGMCASGKSTLAGLLQEVYGCGIVCTDDFFLQGFQRTSKRLDEAGGNIDYERLAPVAQKAADDRSFSYKMYNCKTNVMTGEKQVPATALTVLEGTHALHPEVDAPCDVRVFLMVDSLTQEARVRKRNTPEEAARFLQEWIPQENAYFASFPIRESCDVVIDTTALGVGEA